jgi:hypothetical protein
MKFSKDESVQISPGIGPSRSFPETSTYLREVRSPMDAGSIPVKWFPFNSKEVSVAILPKLSGILPEIPKLFN